jgi:hypothetical protein
MIKQFLNILFVTCCITIFSIDSISSIFERDKTIRCELSNNNDTEDQSEKDCEYHTIIGEIIFIRAHLQELCVINCAHLYYPSNKHTSRIPTPPPEFIL